jgi:hypothetical protein
MVNIFLNICIVAHFDTLGHFRAVSVVVRLSSKEKKNTSSLDPFPMPTLEKNIFRTID